MHNHNLAHFVLIDVSLNIFHVFVTSNLFYLEKKKILSLKVLRNHWVDKVKNKELEMEIRGEERLRMDSQERSGSDPGQYWSVRGQMTGQWYSSRSWVHGAMDNYENKTFICVKSLLNSMYMYLYFLLFSSKSIQMHSTWLCCFVLFSHSSAMCMFLHFFFWIAP